ncbi:PaaI family thioesterase [Snodgrassella communis]|uniref:PaaI family thioesterase n=1 Tax=Snodgrassella communis TaxID=2946699 RepID=UPI001EF63EDF|nr:acyl-CoA thioesterase domain-containing protein [Snodgrassella communis]
MNPTIFQLDEQLTSKAYQSMPYSAAINLKIGTDSQNNRLYCLPFTQQNIGNIFLPALHGGLIGGFLQSCINLYLQEKQNLAEPARIIDYTTDYLLSGKALDSYAQCQILHAGKRISHLTVTMWQNQRDKPIAFARAHLQMPGQ